MDNNKIIENIKRICSNLKPFTKESFEDTTKPSKLFFSKRGLVKIEDLELNAFYEILDEYIKDDFIEKNFSRKYIEKKIGGFIIKIIRKEETKRFENLKQELNNLREEMKKDIREYTFIFPIVNLKIEKKFKIGRVSFFRFPDKHNAIKKKIFTIISRTKQSETEIKNSKRFFEGMLNSLNNFVCAEVKLKAEPTKSRELGKGLVERSLDILRIYSPLNVYSMKSYIGILGDLAGTESRILCFNEENFSFYHERGGFLDSFSVTNDYLKTIKRKELSVINKILDDKRNGFQNSLLTAIHWFGKSIKNVEDKDRFIYFCIALETILTKKDEYIVNCLKERIAFLLEKNKEKRIELSRLIRDLYEIRSQIVQEGFTEISQRDIKNLHLITQQLILKLIKGKEHKNRNEFFRFLEELKYS